MPLSYLPTTSPCFADTQRLRRHACFRFRPRPRAARPAQHPPVRAALSLPTPSSTPASCTREGTSPSPGFDCSAYMHCVFAKTGVGLPRIAEQQRQATTAVSQPRRGDLLLWGVRHPTTPSTLATT